MEQTEIENFIKKNKERHLSNKVLHAHPSPALWTSNFDRLNTKNSLLENEGEVTKVNMYVGIPYCLPTDPPHCGFCLFPTEKYHGKKEASDYLSYLEKEAKLYEKFYQNSELDSLYIGGGTPNLLLPEDYFKLMEIIHNLFPSIKKDTEKTLEGIPQLFNEEKIKAISEAGFNRVSMGVQQVSDMLIQYSGRKQTRKQVFDAIDLFHKYNLSCNIDLIYGWPEQTMDDMLNDLSEIINSGIRHITHYELNIAGRSDFATKQKELVPSINAKIQMYIEAKKFLESNGYKQRTVYDWEKKENTNYSNKNGVEQYHYENNLRDFIPTDEVSQTSCMGGLGYAAINMRMKTFNSKFGSMSTMNHRSLEKYYSDLDANILPIERAFNHEKEDVKLIWLFQSLQEMKIDKIKFNTIFKSNLLSEFQNIWMVLDKMGWIREDKQFLYFINEGEFYIPLVQSLISKIRVDEITLSQAK